MADSFIKKEDFWAIIIGFLFLLIGLVLLMPSKPNGIDNQDIWEEQLEEANGKTPFKSVEWYEQYDKLAGIKASSTPIGKLLSKITGKPGSWETNPLKSFYLSENQAAVIREKNKDGYEHMIAEEEMHKSNAMLAVSMALGKNYQSDSLNRIAEQEIGLWRKSKADLEAKEKKQKTKAFNRIGFLLILMIAFGLIFGFAGKVMEIGYSKFFLGFIFVFFIGVVSYFLAGQAEIKSIGFGYAAWAILLGLVISNTLGTPDWVKPALTTELYIKTGLVVLGAEILLGKILAIGLPGIFVAWIVTPIVLISTFWFGQKVLKISSKTLNMTISADMSVCGVSAAVATAAACNAKKEELTIAIGLSMIFTSVMMIVLPAIINGLGMPEVLGGAWIGGTIDATGAVVAAGAFLGEKALSVAATIKMIQNVLIGIIAFGVAVYFSSQGEDGVKAKFSWAEIWARFPKFILGFLGASIIFSIIYTLMGENDAYTYIDQGVIGGFTKNIRGWLFCLAFVSIGLSINFKDLRHHFTGGKPLMLYVCGQLFNLLLTLGMAYLMFYKVFPGVTAGI